jgi:hypothetical protein
LAKAAAHDVKLLAGPIDNDNRRSAMLQFPGGYIAEVHSQK